LAFGQVLCHALELPADQQSGADNHGKGKHHYVGLCLGTRVLRD
jgi:hypothetical protein